MEQNKKSKTEKIWTKVKDISRMGVLSTAIIAGSFGLESCKKEKELSSGGANQTSSQTTQPHAQGFVSLDKIKKLAKENPSYSLIDVFPIGKRPIAPIIHESSGKSLDNLVSFISFERGKGDIKTPVLNILRKGKNGKYETASSVGIPVVFDNGKQSKRISGGMPNVAVTFSGIRHDGFGVVNTNYETGKKWNSVDIVHSDLEKIIAGKKPEISFSISSGRYVPPIHPLAVDKDYLVLYSINGPSKEDEIIITSRERKEEINLNVQDPSVVRVPYRIPFNVGNLREELKKAGIENPQRTDIVSLVNSYSVNEKIKLFLNDEIKRETGMEDYPHSIIHYVPNSYALGASDSSAIGIVPVKSEKDIPAWALIEINLKELGKYKEGRQK